MASQPLDDIDQDDDDVLELDTPLEDQGDEIKFGDVEVDEADEFVGFADEPETPPADTDLVKHLRQQIRERDKRLSEVVRAAPAEEPIVVGERPKIADFDFDEDRFDTAMNEWDDRRRAAEKQSQARDSQKQRQEDDWNKVVQGYATKKAALRFPDVAEAEETAFASLSPAAQALIAKHADNAAVFVYAVGKSPSKLAELARIDSEGDPFALVKAITKMEANVTTRKPPRAPDPDTPVRGRAVSAGGDKELARLQADADKTHDRTKVAAYLAGKRGK